MPKYLLDTNACIAIRNGIAGLRHGALRATLERAGSMIAQNDLWIAAHALAAGMTVVASERNDFGRVPDLTHEDRTA